MYNVFLSLSGLLIMIISRSIQVAANGIFHSFYGWLTFLCINYHIFLIHSSVDGHLGCFHVLAIVNKDAVNTGVLLELWFSLDICPRVGLKNHMVALLLVFWEPSYCFHRDCINFHFHQQCRSVPFSLHRLQNLLFLDFFPIYFLFVGG